MKTGPASRGPEHTHEIPSGDTGTTAVTWVEGGFHNHTFNADYHSTSVGGSPQHTHSMTGDPDEA